MENVIRHVYDRRSFDNMKELESAILDAIAYVQMNSMDAILDLYKGIRQRLCCVLCKQGNFYNK